MSGTKACCLLCSGSGKVDGKPCFCQVTDWKVPVVNLGAASKNSAKPSDLIIGDPLAFKGVDQGWDLESKQVSSVIVEAFKDEVEALDGKQQVVPDGVLLNKNLTPVEYKKAIGGKNFVSSVKSKKLNAMFEIWTRAGIYHVFLMVFDSSEMDAGLTTPERANKMAYFGVFQNKHGAKDAVDDFLKRFEEISKRPDFKQKRYTTQELGLSYEG